MHIILVSLIYYIYAGMIYPIYVYLSILVYAVDLNDYNCSARCSEKWFVISLSIG